MWGTLLALLVVQATFGAALQVDPNGYVVYCPCMGKKFNNAIGFLEFFQVDSAIRPISFWGRWRLRSTWTERSCCRRGWTTREER